MIETKKMARQMHTGNLSKKENTRDPNNSC